MLKFQIHIKFQFQMVQLKVGNFRLRKEVLNKFQFQMVQLKVVNRFKHIINTIVSIPNGSIKSPFGFYSAFF